MRLRNAALLFGGALILGRTFRANYSFRNKVAVITGGSRGLGLELARKLIRSGSKVVLAARKQETLEAAKQDLLKLGGKAVITIQCDITNAEEVNNLITKTVEAFGRIDLLFNVAGIITVGPFDSLSREDFELQMKTHFWGPFHAIRAALPVMRRQRSGRIVNISSIGGKVAVPHLSAYCASKFALAGFSESIQPELRKDGIHVLTVCPSLMRTGSPRNAGFKGDHETEYTWFKISDSLPVISMNSELAAERILSSCRRGKSETAVSLLGALGIKTDAVFPNLTAGVKALITRLLPDSRNTDLKLGKELENKTTQSFLTQLTDRAAERNSELIL